MRDCLSFSFLCPHRNLKRFLGQVIDFTNLNKNIFIETFSYGFDLIGELFMETYIDIFMNVDGEKASIIFDKLQEIGLKYHIGEHDFIHDWKRAVTISEELAFIERIQEKLQGTGVILKFSTLR